MYLKHFSRPFKRKGARSLQVTTELIVSYKPFDEIVYLLGKLGIHKFIYKKAHPTS